MICRRCLVRLERTALPIARRTYASAASSKSAPRGPATEEHEGRPAATSTSAAQPFSSVGGDHATPGEVSEAKALGPSGTADQIESLPKKKSILEAGQPLNVGYFKNKEQAVALEDNEYPPWLWTLLDFGAKGGAGGGDAADGNVYSKSKAQRRKATKAAKKNAADDPDSLLPKVPLDHQTIDLPIGDGTIKGAIEASKARDDLRDAMRTRRRKDIKTRNYLGTMR